MKATFTTAPISSITPIENIALHNFWSAILPALSQSIATVTHTSGSTGSLAGKDEPVRAGDVRSGILHRTLDRSREWSPLPDQAEGVALATGPL